MKLISLCLTLFVSGCCTIPPPVKPPEFPPISEALKKKCPELVMAAVDSELLSDLVKTVTINYGEYHKCKAIVDAWQLWYEEQKINSEKLRNDRMHTK